MGRNAGQYYFYDGSKYHNYTRKRFRYYTVHCHGVTCTLLPSNIVLTTIIVGLLLYMVFKPTKTYIYPEDILGPWIAENDTWAPDPDQACLIPQLDPFDKSILPFLTGPPDIRCYQRFAWITFVDQDGWLRLNESAVRDAGYNGINDTSLDCEYAPIQRVVGDDSAALRGPSRPLTFQGAFLDSDFVRAHCKNFVGFTFYENYHVNIKAVSPSELKPAGCSVDPSQQFLQSSKESSTRPLNVIVLGFDSMSRSNFVRQLPLSRRYLLNNLGAVELRGYNKVGDNTYPNFVPLLTGLHHRSPKLPPAEFTDDTGEDFGDDQELRRVNVNADGAATYPYHDEWPFIWKKYEQNGYVTLFSEDMPPLAMFNYAGQGFYLPPTHHYVRPFWMAAYSSVLHSISRYLCLGATPTHEITLDYLERFAKTYANLGIPYFGISLLAEISHDYVNQAGAIDDLFLKWLTRLHQSGALNHTLLVVLSDHGYRYGKMRRTAVGRLEDRMPFCAVAVPPKYVQRYPEFHNNLISNAFRLSTPYDIHATLTHILESGKQCGNTEDATSGTTISFHNDSDYGQSLLAPIPRNRTCIMAGIPPPYCICRQEKDIAVEDNRSKIAADALVVKLNSITAPYREQCAELSLDTTVEAQVIYANQKDIVNSNTTEMRVTIKTLPGEGIFEGFVHLDLKSPPSVVDVMEDINRVNSFGQQSACLSEEILRTNRDLKMYCYCMV